MKLTITCLAAVAAISLGGCAESGGEQAAAAMTEAATPPEELAPDGAGGMAEKGGETGQEPAY